MHSSLFLQDLPSLCQEAAAVWGADVTQLSFSSCGESRVSLELAQKAEEGVWRVGRHGIIEKDRKEFRADSSTCEHGDFGIGGGGRNSSDRAMLVKCWAENTGFWVRKSSQGTWGGTRAHKH